MHNYWIVSDIVYLGGVSLTSKGRTNLRKQAAIAFSFLYLATRRPGSEAGKKVFHMNSERSLHASVGTVSSAPDTRLRGACSCLQHSQRKFSSYLRSFSVTQLWHRAVPHVAQDVKCMDCGPWLQKQQYQ